MTEESHSPILAGQAGQCRGTGPDPNPRRALSRRRSRRLVRLAGPHLQELELDLAPEALAVGSPTRTPGGAALPDQLPGQSAQPARPELRRELAPECRRLGGL